MKLKEPAIVFLAMLYFLPTVELAAREKSIYGSAGSWTILQSHGPLAGCYMEATYDTDDFARIGITEGDNSGYLVVLADEFQGLKIGTKVDVELVYDSGEYREIGFGIAYDNSVGIQIFFEHMGILQNVVDSETLEINIEFASGSEEIELEMDETEAGYEILSECARVN